MILLLTVNGLSAIVSELFKPVTFNLWNQSVTKSATIKCATRNLDKNACEGQKINILFQSWYSLVVESAFGIIISDPVLIFGSGVKTAFNWFLNQIKQLLGLKGKGNMAPFTFEDKERLQTDSKGIRFNSVGQSLSWEHERDCHLAKANQNTNAARLAYFDAG